MVWINTSCENYPAATKDSFGGARCICPKCQKERAEQSPQAEQATASCLSDLLGERTDTVVDWDNFNGDIAFRAPVNKAISHINILCDFLTHPNTTDEGDLKNMIMRTQLAIASMKDVEQNLFNRCMQAREDNRAD